MLHLLVIASSLFDFTINFTFFKYSLTKTIQSVTMQLKSLTVPRQSKGPGIQRPSGERQRRLIVKCAVRRFFIARTGEEGIDGLQDLPLK